MWGEKEMYDGEKDLARAAAFDFLIGHTDRHTGNWMVKEGKLRLIDNGLAFATVPPKPHGNYMFNMEARHKNLKVPEEVANWDGEKIGAALKKAGIEGEAIKLVKERLAHLKERLAQGVRIPPMAKPEKKFKL